MSDDRAKRIAERAYELWEQEGRPEGRHHEHWIEAERQLDGASETSGQQKSRQDRPTGPGVASQGQQQSSPPGVGGSDSRQTAPR